nr:ATP-grasp domain-containing protein [Prochlorococcus marinus]
MSKLCEFLNLPGVSSSISETVHDKFKFREFSAKNNICVPKYEIYKENDLKNLTNILDKYTLPFIIKNVDSSGSRGTKIFYSRDKKEEERIAKEAITVSKSRSFLVESVWTGKECTVETLFDKEGIFHKCFITDRKFDYSNGYPIELGLVSPSQLSSKIQEECFTLAENVSNKLGIKIGAAKFDMIITNDGPKIIEMTTRLSGGFDCQYVVPASTGKNVVMAAVMTACGTNFPDFLLENKFNKVCVTGSHWPENGRIKNIKNLEKVKNMEGVEHIFFRKKVGDLIENYSNCTDRVDFIICSGINYDKANKNLEAAISELKIEITNE